MAKPPVTLKRVSATSLTRSVSAINRGVKWYGKGQTSTTGHLSGSNVDDINNRIHARIGRQRNAAYRPSGPALAEEIFRTSWSVDEPVEASSDGDYDGDFEDVDSWAYQPSLELETPLELQERLQRQIRKFEDAYSAMCLAATRWHQLMEDVEYDTQIRKMFLDMQMVRKLSGLDSE